MRARTFVWATFLVLAALQFSQSAHGQAGGREGASGVEAEADRPTAFVTVDGRALFRVRGFSAFPAKERAEAIAKRIVAIANDATVSPDSLRAVEAEQVTNILAGDRIIMAVTDADASLEGGVSRPLLAKAFLLRIAEATSVYRQDRSLRQLLTNTGYALGATVVLGIVLVLVRRLFLRLDAVAEKRFKSRVEALRIQSFQVVQTESFWKSVRTTFRTVRTIAVLACLVVYAQVVLGLYPWTRPTAQHLLLMLLDPLRNMALGFIAMLPNLAFLAILFVVMRYLLPVFLRHRAWDGHFLGIRAGVGPTHVSHGARSGGGVCPRGGLSLPSGLAVRGLQGSVHLAGNHVLAGFLHGDS